MFELKRQFKELARLRKEIGDSYVGNAVSFIWNLIAVYLSMSVLNATAVVFYCQDSCISLWFLEKEL